MSFLGFGGSSEAAGGKARTLAFPSGEGLGMLWSREQGAPLNARWKQIGPATGKIAVPAGQELMLQVRCEMIPDLSLFSRFGSDEFHTLDLLETKIQDSHLTHLRHFSGLISLNLSRTEITDVGLAHLSGLTGLLVLTLYGTKVADAGLANLKDLLNLQTLWVNRTGVTDAGLAHLKELKSLKEIYVADTAITEAGRKQFQQWNPNCYVRTGKGSIWSY